VEQGQILQENIPAEDLAEGEVEEEENDEKQMIDFLNNIIFKLSGSTTLGTPKNQIMKTLLGQFVYKNPDAFEDSRIKAKTFYNKFENDTLTLLARRDDKRDARLEFQKELIDIFQKYIPREIQDIPANVRLISDAKRENGMRGSGYGMKNPVKDEYIPIGKYKAHKT
jgi:hypothetical protein